MTPARYELTRYRWVRRILASRWMPWGLMAATLPFFVLAILASLFGTPAGNRNFGIVFVWIVWWALLIMVLVPLGGRAWCAACPIPAPGEWLQRRALLGPRPGVRPFTLGLKWPRRLSNMWLQNVGFLGVALFSAVILTTPLVTGLVLTGFVGLAIAASLLFEGRIFCRYLCPVGGFIGLYSQVAPVELRARDPKLCATHPARTCTHGCPSGYGCPWLVFPGGLRLNTYCGLCTECLKTCPRDNMALYARPFGADLVAPGSRRLDEAFKGFIMLTCALAYSAVLIGPWAVLKETALAVFSPGWFVYAAGFLGANLVVTPGLFYLAVALAARFAKPLAARRRLFADYAAVLVPLGLAAWVAFSLSFVLVNLSYAWPVLSDPFGWGWNLFGTANWGWTPYAAGLVPYLQAPVLVAGLLAATGLAVRTALQRQRQPLAALPIIGFCAAFTGALLWLYMG